MGSFTVEGKWRYSEGVVSELQFDPNGLSKEGTKTECRVLLADGNWNKCPSKIPSTSGQAVGCMVKKAEEGLPIGGM